MPRGMVALPSFEAVDGCENLTASARNTRPDAFIVSSVDLINYDLKIQVLKVVKRPLCSLPFCQPTLFSKSSKNRGPGGMDAAKKQVAAVRLLVGDPLVGPFRKVSESEAPLSEGGRCEGKGRHHTLGSRQWMEGGGEGGGMASGLSIRTPISPGAILLLREWLRGGGKAH